MVEFWSDDEPTADLVRAQIEALIEQREGLKGLRLIRFWGVENLTSFRPERLERIFPNAELEVMHLPERPAQPSEGETKTLERIRALGGVALVRHDETRIALKNGDEEVLAEIIIETDKNPEKAAFTVILDGHDDVDEILGHVLSLGTVEQLSLVETGVTDDALEQVGKLHSLRLLYLSKTAITDLGMSHLRKLDRLEMLALAHTKVTDEGLAQLDHMASLKGLSLHGLPITDAGLSHVAKLKNLVSLSLRGTRITNAGLERLFDLAHLRGLELRDTEVTESGVRRLKEALPECKIGDGVNS